MLFQKIFVEKEVRAYPQTRKILQAFPNVPLTQIDKVEDVFERARKPYLQKRTSLNLFVGRKEGQLVKEAPDAYGVAGDPHYYFIHAYNCIYECEYCYLQGYFYSPDLVLYVNHEDIINEIERIVDLHPDWQTSWFHAGEFSDSLALSHITDEWCYYWELFKRLPNARMELRTKSINVNPVLKLGPLSNIVITFSLSPAVAVRQYDRKTPSLRARLRAIGSLAEAGFRIGLHFDPIIYQQDFQQQYHRLIQDLLAVVPEHLIQYISLGVARFTRNVYQEFVKNYPDSSLHAGEFVKSFDRKIRYNRPLRLYMLKTVRKMLYDAGIAPEKVYLCMENET